MIDQSSLITCSEVPVPRAPSKKRSLSEAIRWRSFLPIALRRSSASGPLKPAIALAICINCSWYRITE